MILHGRNDTITALSSPPGTGAIALIRISGPEAFSIAESIFQPAKKSAGRKEMIPGTVLFGTIIDDEAIVDEVLLSVFRAPRTFTGDDTVEISCHGSPYIQQRIISLVLRKGARLAEPGEFTLRAFLNGKMDLSQAEAVADLIASDSEAAHRLAMQQMRGGFSSEIKKMREKLIHFASLLELELDFGEEDVEFANREELLKMTKDISVELRKLIDSFESGNVLKSGIPVVIAGKPNVGKSTLLNLLVNEDRAIVSEIAGTTRDTIEEAVILDGIKFRFIDTAGIRETNDAIEKIGVQKTWEKIHQSPVLIYLSDANDTTVNSLQQELKEIQEQSSAQFRIIPVVNKIDGKNIAHLINEFRTVENILFISAKEGTNLHELTSQLLKDVHSGILKISDHTVTNARHQHALTQTLLSLEEVEKGIRSGLTHDFIAGSLRIALHYLGEITGEISSDDLLANIFSKFCIGK